MERFIIKKYAKEDLELKQKILKELAENAKNIEEGEKRRIIEEYEEEKEHYTKGKILVVTEDEHILYVCRIIKPISEEVYTRAIMDSRKKGTNFILELEEMGYIKHKDYYHIDWTVVF